MPPSEKHLGLPLPPLYFVTPSTPAVEAFVSQKILGQLTTPEIYNPLVDGAVIAADNGCFSKKWRAEKWSQWLIDLSAPTLWATVPDVVGDHDETLRLWDRWASFVAVDAGHSPAFVLQDGCTTATAPTDAEALFIGGSTEFKLSEEAEKLVYWGKDRGMQIHMGRVNSRRRYRLARKWGVDSVDGTHLSFAPDQVLPELIRWIYDNRPQEET